MLWLRHPFALISHITLMLKNQPGFKKSLSTSLSQISLTCITGAKKITLIHKRMWKEKVGIKGIDLVQLKTLNCY